MGRKHVIQLIGCGVFVCFLPLSALAAPTDNMIPQLSLLLFKNEGDSGTCASGSQTILWQGRIWQRCADGKQYNWTEADEYCQMLDLGGFSDWRLPTEDEGLELVGAPDLVLYMSYDNVSQGSEDGYLYWSSSYAGEFGGEALYATISFSSATGGPDYGGPWYETYLLGALCTRNK